jgi:hypothetical protein
MSFIDGAIHHDCPVNVADREHQLIWADMRHHEPDLLLSIGTGIRYKARGDHQDLKSAGRKLQKAVKRVGGILYLWRTVNSMLDNQIDCEQTWGEHFSKVSLQRNETLSRESKRRHVRINVSLKGTPPKLDDVDRILQLAKDAQSYFSRGPEIKEVAHRLIASCFYFKKEGQYRAEGRPTCYDMFNS